MYSKIDRGFTLIEVLVSLLILAVGALALAQLMTTGAFVNARTKDDTEISSVAQQLLEQIFESGYDNLPVGGDLYSAVSGYSQTGVRLENSASASDFNTYHQNAATYDIFWQVTDAGTVADVPLKEIAVRVVSNRMTMGATARETTVRTQISRSY